MIRAWKPRTQAALVGIIAAATGAAWILLAGPTEPTSDALMYSEAAEGLAMGAGYLNGGIPSAYWAPGFPLALAPFYALFGATINTVVAVNLMLRILAAVVAYALARVVLKSDSWALLFGILVSLLPGPLFYTSQAMSENLAVVLVLALAACLVAWFQRPQTRIVLALLMGACLGALILARPVAQVLILAIPLLSMRAARERSVWMSLGAFVAGLALIMSPWLIRNVVVLGAPVVTTNQGANLLIAYTSDPPGSFDQSALDPVVPVFGPEDEIIADREYRRRATEAILAEPLRVPVTMAATSLGMFVTPVGEGALRPIDVVSLIAVPFRLAMVTITFLVVLRGRNRYEMTSRAIGAVALWWFAVHIALAPMGSVRFLVPVESLMLLTVLVWFKRRRAIVGSAGD